MEIKVDAMGQPCPQPVIRAKKTIEAMTEPGSVQVLVDNEVATSNLAKLAVQKNLESTTIKLDENQYSVTIKVTKEAIGMEQECDEVLQKNLVVVLSSDKMGDGDPELGTLLMKGFVYAISQ
ncbi:MAG: sulfurtransferase TusA family protein, partial [Lachnospiraceae bacterium]